MLISLAIATMLGVIGAPLLMTGNAMGAAFSGGGARYAVEGTIALDTASLETLTNATALGNCTYIDGDPTATIGTTAADIPGSPLEGRTAITIWNHSSNKTMVCSASGTASPTRGLLIYGDGQWWKWEGLGAGVTISCACTSGTCTYGFLEEKCYQ